MYRHAAQLLSVSRSFIENLVSRGIDGRSSRLSERRGHGLLGSRLARARPRVARPRRSHDRRSYIGTVGMAHDVGTILEAAALTRRSGEDVRFLVVGDGAERGSAHDRASAEGLAHVTFTGLVLESGFRIISRRANISLVTLKRSDVFKAVLPSRCRVDGGGTANRARGRRRGP